MTWLSITEKMVFDLTLFLQEPFGLRMDLGIREKRRILNFTPLLRKKYHSDA